MSLADCEPLSGPVTSPERLRWGALGKHRVTAGPAHPALEGAALEAEALGPAHALSPQGGAIQILTAAERRATFGMVLISRWWSPAQTRRHFSR